MLVVAVTKGVKSCMKQPPRVVVNKRQKVLIGNAAF